MNADETDIKILRLLQQNGRITNLQLSQEIGLSTASTLERVKKLETSGTIRGYTATIAEEKLGFDLQIFLLVSMTTTLPADLERATDVFKNIKAITECYRLAGRPDFLLKVVTQNMKTYEKIFLLEMATIPHIGNIVLLPVMHEVKDAGKVPAG